MTTNSTVTVVRIERDRPVHISDVIRQLLPDYLPDVAIARISTRSASETADVVDKLVTYERATFTTDTWVKAAGFIAINASRCSPGVKMSEDAKWI